MKRLALLVAVAVTFLLSACASAPAPQTPAQAVANLADQVNKSCLVVQPTIATLQTQTALLTGSQLADLTTAAALADKVCTTAAASTSTVETASVSEFLTTALPLVTVLVDVAPIDPAEKAAAAAALALVKVALSQALAQ